MVDGSDRGNACELVDQPRPVVFMSRRFGVSMLYSICGDMWMSRQVIHRCRCVTQPSHAKNATVHKLAPMNCDTSMHAAILREVKQQSAPLQHRFHSDTPPCFHHWMFDV